MRLKRSTIKQAKRTGHHQAVIILLLLVSALPSFGFAAAAPPVTVKLQQLNTLKSSGAKTTLYLKRLIEQRTAQRVKISILPHLPSIDPANGQQQADMQFAVADKISQVERLTEQPPYKMKRIDDYADNNYHLFISVDFWNQLTDELQIIMQGAIKDSLAYHAELERKN